MEKKKYSRFIIEIANNGFVTQAYEKQTYGDDSKPQNIRANIGEVVAELLQIEAHNQMIDAETLAEKKKKDEAMI